MPRSPGRTGRPWLRLRKQVLAEEDTCCYCHTYVDKTLDGRHNPMGPHIAHIVSLALGGDPRDRSNVHLAHRICNLKVGDGKRRRSVNPPRKQSRAW